MIDTSTLFPMTIGRLPAAARTPSAEFDLLCATLTATLIRIDRLHAAIDREEAKLRPDRALIALLQGQIERAEDLQARIERDRLGVYRAMTSAMPPHQTHKS